eukprot:3449741-Pyramimonas_sp.AAC.1
MAAAIARVAGMEACWFSIVSMDMFLDVGETWVEAWTSALTRCAHLSNKKFVRREPSEWATVEDEYLV